MTDLAGKVAWITGAGSGIGQACAAALATAGAEVVLSGRRKTALEETAELIQTAGGKSAIMPLDVTDTDATQRASADIDAHFGRIDLLVNSAGSNVAGRHWDEPDMAGWGALVDVNVKGAYHLAAACLPIMRRQKDGLIITISSWAARYDAYVAGAPYNAAKRATLALNTSLNMEEGRHGVRACAICPAEVATSLLRNRPVPVPEKELARMLQPEDLGALVLFIARQPPHVCMNEILISPTWNRNYLGSADFHPPPAEP